MPVFTGYSFSQDSKNVVQIQTNAQCTDCKQRLEKELNYTKGISYAELNMATKQLEIKYNPKKISVDDIRKTISEIGYDADSIKANPVKQAALPSCCQPGGGH